MFSRASSREDVWRAYCPALEKHGAAPWGETSGSTSMRKGSAVVIGLVNGKPAVIVLNSCPPDRGFAEAGIVTEARRALSVYGLPVCPVAVSQRVAFSHALSGGLAVTEFEPEGKAAGEIRKLWTWLCANAQS